MSASAFAARLLANGLRTTRVYCRQKLLGCDYRDSLSEMEEHEDTCPFREVACPAAIANKCTWRGCINTLIAHARESSCCSVSVLVDLFLNESRKEIIIFKVAENADRVSFDVPDAFDGNSFDWVYKPIFFPKLSDEEFVPFLMVHMHANKGAYMQMRAFATEAERRKYEYTLRIFSDKCDQGEYTYTDYPSCATKTFVSYKILGKMLFLTNYTLRGMRVGKELFRLAASLKDV